MTDGVRKTAVVSVLLAAVGLASVSAATLGGVSVLGMLALDGPSWAAVPSGLFLLGGLAGLWRERTTFDGLPDPAPLPRLAVTIGH